jgi:hypothetical protein
MKLGEEAGSGSPGDLLRKPSAAGRQQQQVAAAGWSDISSKAIGTLSPDLPAGTAFFLLSTYIVGNLFPTLLHFHSRVTAGVGGLDFQNGCYAVMWVVTIPRNLWIISHLKRSHPIGMRDGYGIPSLIYHSLFGNASSLILKLLSYALIGYFFKAMAFAKEGHCVIDPGSGVRHAATDVDCDEMVSRGNWAVVEYNGTMSGLCVGDLQADSQAECEESIAVGQWVQAETKASSTVLFAMQAVNYPILCLTLTAMENSFVKVRWIALMVQLFMILMLVDNIALHILYILDEQFNPQFASMVGRHTPPTTARSGSAPYH